MSDLGTVLKLLEMAFRALNQDKSEKFENEWEKDKPKLTKAAKEGDIETIKEITSKYYEL